MRTSAPAKGTGASINRCGRGGYALRSNRPEKGTVSSQTVMGGAALAPPDVDQCIRWSSKPAEDLIRSSVPGMYFFSSSWK